MAPTYLDFVWSDFKGLNDTGQEGFDLLEVTVADTPGPIHQKEHVHRCGGPAAELGAAWVGREGVRCGQDAPSLQHPKLLWAGLQPPGVAFPGCGGG